MNAGKQAFKTLSNSVSAGFALETNMKSTTIAPDSSKVDTNNFLEAVRHRRTIYNIDKQIPISDERVIEIVKYAVNWVPSSFNVQSSRVKILLGSQHDKFWDGLKEILRKIVPADKFEPTDKKISSFGAGYGTVLFFDETNDIKQQQEQYPTYADKFYSWSDHSNGMLQYVIWTALEAEGCGCSLQHYNPLVDELVQKEWDAPKSWRLIAQMPFGRITAPPGEKTFKPIDSRVQVYK